MPSKPIPRWLKWIIAVQVVIASLYLLACVHDIVDITNDPETYRNVYHLGEAGTEFSTIASFQLWRGIQAVLTAIYITLNLLLLKISNRYYRLAIITLDLFVLLWVVLGYISWAQSGFDH